MPGVSSERVVAVLGRGVVPADAPILLADDLGALRGDGIFETMHARDGRAWLVDEHLSRMARSAALMELALPPREDLVDLIDQALAHWPSSEEGALRLICTRGPEGSPARASGASATRHGATTVFATISGVTASMIRSRRDGVAVLTASLGFTAGSRAAAPWLLGGAKTLSYAVNMASQRWAQSLGADDVLWVSADGFALEAPTSTLVWLDGSTLCTVPVEPTGILAGTTARWLLDHADALGWTAGERMVTAAELLRTDGAWFTSSVRGVAAIRELDGKPMPHTPDLTGKIRDLLGYA
jgi:4-amino-4-deoxychorismate lyase